MVAFKDGRRVSVVASKCECGWVGWDDEEEEVEVEGDSELDKEERLDMLRD